MTGRPVLDLALFVAAQFLILAALPWVVLNIAYLGEINPRAHREQRATELNARVFLGWPATVALCWWAAGWFGTHHDVVLVVYIALVARLILATANFVSLAGNRAHPGSRWVHVALIAPVVCFAAALLVSRQLPGGNLTFWDWALGGLLALALPPIVTLALGFVAFTAFQAVS